MTSELTPEQKEYFKTHQKPMHLNAYEIEVVLRLRRLDFGTIEIQKSGGAVTLIRTSTTEKPLQNVPV